MTEATKLFALATADDDAALLAALGETAAPVRNENGETLYLFCLYRGRTKCAEALKARGGLTLHEAAAAGEAARVEECLRAAPWTVHSLSADGWSALHLAAFLGRDAVVEQLLALGADARQWGRAFETNLALHAACSGGRLGNAALAKLVAATGDPDVTPKHGFTPLMQAAAGGYESEVEVLLAAGADRTRKHPEKQMTPADFARERGHAALAERLAV